MSTFAEALSEYRRLHGIIVESVYNVDFPFGVVEPVRKRMEEIAREHGIARCSDCEAIFATTEHVCE